VKFANRNRVTILKFKINNIIMLNLKNINIVKLNKSLKHKNASSYKIVRVINNYVYKLKLLESIKLIYSIFYS